MKEKFLETIRETFDIQDRQLEGSDLFREYPEWDSLNRLSLIAMLDEEYGVTIEDSVFTQLNTLDQLWAEVETRKSAN